MGLSDPKVGPHFTTAAGGRRVGRVLSVEPGVQLTGSVMGAVMSYVLVPDGDRTRLLLKVLAEGGPVWARLLCLGDLLMARRQLHTLAHLAEGTALRSCGQLRIGDHFDGRHRSLRPCCWQV